MAYQSPSARIILDVTAIASALRRNKASLDRLVAPVSPGVYGIFLRDGKALGPYRTLPDEAIYVGSTSNLNAREFDHHFSVERTGFSTLRRSIGAILREELALTPMPRAPGPSESNVRNYRFQADGEARLSAWMTASLLISVYPCNDALTVEKELLRELRPLLNLTGWPNDDRAEVKRLRKICADAARSRRA
jgi:hypothetical protein